MFPDIPWFAEIDRLTFREGVPPVTKTRLSAKWECAEPPEGIRAGATVWGAARVVKELQGGAVVTWQPETAPRVWLPRATVTDCYSELTRRRPLITIDAVVVGPIFPCSDLDPFLVPVFRDCDLNALGALLDVLEDRAATDADRETVETLRACMASDFRTSRRVTAATLNELTARFAGVRYGA